MKTRLSKQQIDSYRENGFVVLNNFLAPEELETWRASLDDAIKQRGQQRILHHEEKVDENAYYNNVFVQRVNLWQDNEKIRQLMLDRRLGKLAAQLAGVDGIRIWHDQALIKQPYGNPTAWHLDNPYWSFSSRQAISIWVALDNATLANGCLWYIPGSHKTAKYDSVGIGKNLAGLFRLYPEWAKLEAQPADCRAGSCVFHNGLVAHGAGANMTPRARRAMTCAYMPDGSTFNGQKNVLPDAYFKSLKPGDLLNDQHQNPLIWKS